MGRVQGCVTLPLEIFEGGCLPNLDKRRVVKWWVGLRTKLNIDTMYKRDSE